LEASHHGKPPGDSPEEVFSQSFIQVPYIQRRVLVLVVERRGSERCAALRGGCQAHGESGGGEDAQGKKAASLYFWWKLRLFAVKIEREREVLLRGVGLGSKGIYPKWI